MSANPQPFASLDPELSSIAARAAVEVDALIHLRDVGSANLARLADAMTSAFGEAPPQAGPVRFLDPVATELMLRTLQDARPTNLNSYEALRAASLELARHLRATSPANNKETLEDLKRFCLALSKHALATSYSRDESQGAKIHRR